MSAGVIQQIGTPREIYERPINKFVADFVGTTNFVEGRVTARDDSENGWVVATEIGPIRSVAVEPLNPGDDVVLSIRPEDIELTEARPDVDANVWQGIVDQKVFVGDASDFQVKVGNRTLLARTHPSLRTRIGEPIWAYVHAEKSVAMPAVDELKAAA